MNVSPVSKRLIREVCEEVYGPPFAPTMMVLEPGGRWREMSDRESSLLAPWWYVRPWAAIAYLVVVSDMAVNV